VSDVTGFYDEFVDYQLSYLTTPNPRLRRVRELLSPLIEEREPRSALDVGCGIGLIAGWLAKRIPRVVGVDLSPRAVETAKELHPELEFHVCAPPGDPLPAGPFDLITLIDVVEHFPPKELSAVFERVGEVAADEAVVAVNLPSRLFALDRRSDQDQIIDEALGVDEVVAAAAAIDLEPLVVTRYGCESSNQYAFCAFSRTYDVSTPLQRTLRGRLEDRVWATRERLRGRGSRAPR
jgi:SAM-dependent methyltransferase